MATVTTTIGSSFVRGAVLVVHVRPISLFSSSIIGFPTIATKGKVRCTMEGKPSSGEDEKESKLGMSASLALAACAAAMSSPAAMALVDERLSTEGTGLPFGLSNNLLGWILFLVFGLIWALYFTYTSSLDEDDDSGLSL